MGVIPWSPLLEAGCPGAGARTRERHDRALRASPRALRPVAARRTSASSTPSRSLPQLAEQTGITLIELAIAFVLRHPAVTAPIIGPRTMEHLESQLTAADVVLSDEVLDRIDEINPAGRDDQSRRQRLAQPHPAGGGPAALTGAIGADRQLRPRTFVWLPARRRAAT